MHHRQIVPEGGGWQCVSGSHKCRGWTILEVEPYAIAGGGSLSASVGFEFSEGGIALMASVPERERPYRHVGHDYTQPRELSWSCSKLTEVTWRIRTVTWPGARESIRDFFEALLDWALRFKDEQTAQIVERVWTHLAASGIVSPSGFWWTRHAPPLGGHSTVFSARRPEGFDGNWMPDPAHLHLYGLDVEESLSELARLTEDATWRMLADDHWEFAAQLVPKVDGQFNAYAGMVTEQFYFNDWSALGNSVCLFEEDDRRANYDVGPFYRNHGNVAGFSHAWCTAFVLKAAIQRILPDSPSPRRNHLL
ncbi:MAG: hypothetical protein IAE94_03385 [Chthoniobacterales bacterium]|nr:hypothetical protein [Chthoniobacterales bacterium]